MSQPLLFDEIKFDRKFSLEDIIKTPDDSDIGYFLEVERERDIKPNMIKNNSVPKKQNKKLSQNN